MSSSGGCAPRTSLPASPGPVTLGVSRRGTHRRWGLRPPPASPKCVGTRPRGARTARESGVRPRHPAPAPQPGGRCRAPVTPAGGHDGGLPLGRDTLAARGLTPPPRRDRQWLNSGLMSGEATLAGASPPRRPPRAGIPGPSAPPGPQRVNSVRAGPSADVFGLCFWERKRPSEGGISPLGFKGKTWKKREVLCYRAPEPALRCCQPWCGTGDPSVRAGAQLAEGQWGDSGFSLWVIRALESRRSGWQPSRHLLSLQRDGTGNTKCVLSGV